MMTDTKTITMHPFLPISPWRATRHTFVRYEGVTLYTADGGPYPGVALIYRCNETGAERRWGIE